MRLIKENHTAKNWVNMFLIIFSAITGGVSIVTFTSVIEAPGWIASASFTLVFSLTTGIIRKLLSKDMIRLLSWLKINSIVLKL